MPIELEKESKNLNKFIEYVEAQVNYTQEEIKSDLLERGLSEEEATYVMTFYKPHIKQRMFSRSFSFCGRIRRLEYCTAIHGIRLMMNCNVMKTHISNII